MTRWCAPPRNAHHRRASRSILPRLSRSPKFSNLFGFLPLPGLRGVTKRMPEVIIHDDESFERALKRFKKKCEKAGILSDLRKHRHFEKPSEKRKRKMNAAVRKSRRGPRVPRA
jgi:small subunit ribosomal protein S21